jgi:two-component system phosphate regulon response regulator PhoB
MKKNDRTDCGGNGKVVAFKAAEARGVSIQVKDAESREKALRLLREQAPDIFFLELVFSGSAGRDLAGRLDHDFELKKIQTFQVPIFGDTPKDLPDDFYLHRDELAGHTAGGLSVARLQAVPKKKTFPAPDCDPVVHVGDIRIYPGRREVYVGPLKVALTFTHFNILWLLARKPGWVFTNYQIIDAARGPDANIQESSLKTHIFNLRKRLGHAGGCIEAVPGVGYRLRDDTN